MTEHVWVLVFGYTITPAEAQKIALSETDGRRAQAIADAVGPKMKRNDFRLQGPSCYTCEQVWSIDVAQQPCPGDPTMVMRS